jgi:hypothetical protein
MAELPSLAPGINPDQVYGNSSDGDLRARKAKMADVIGVKIIDLTAAGSSDDGEHVWITHRLGDGSEYPLVYHFEAVGYLITVLTDAARSASRRRSLQNPAEAGEGLNTNVIAVEEVRVGTSPETSGAILHLTTADNIPIAVELPVAVLGDVVEQLQLVLKRAERKERSGRRLH